jgi:MFS family permease
MWLGRHDVWLLALGIFVLDIGAQGLQITNQTAIYTIAPDQRSRITSVYIFSFFAGGASGSLATGFMYAHHGWTGVCALGAVISALIIVPALVWHPAKVLAS